MGDPVTATSGIAELLGVGGGSFGTGLVAKFMWDYFKNSSKFMTKEDCKSSQSTCKPITELNTQFLVHKASTETQLKQHDSILNKVNASMDALSKELREGMDEMRGTIQELSTAIAVLVNRDKE